MTSISAQPPVRTYITTAAFHNDIFRYTTSVDPKTFQTSGTLTSLATVGTANASNCPANRILRENGRKLYPSGIIVANSATPGAPNPGVTTYMVGVYDTLTFLNGFIDPNSKIFAPYNTDKPEYVARGINPNGNTEVDQGAPVYTLGSVIAGGAVQAGTTVGAGTLVTAGTKYNVQQLATGTGSVGTPWSTCAGYVNFNGAATASATVYTTAVTASSIVFVTVNNVTPRAISAVPANGSLTIYSSVANDASTVYWFVMN